MTSHTPDIDQAGLVAVSPRRTMIGPVAANIAFVMELTLVPLLLPAIQMQFDLSISELAWVFNAYGIAVAIGVLLGGWCGDAFDTRKIFAIGVACFVAGSLWVAASDSFGSLLVGRILQGCGGGIFSPLVPLLLTRALPQKPGRVLIVWGSIAGYVAAFAPLIYGSFLDERDWNIAFVIIAIIAAIALLALSGSRGVDDPAPANEPAKGYSALFRSRNLWMTYAYVFCTYGSITYYLFRLPVWLSNNEIETASTGLALSIMWLTFSSLSTLLRNRVDSSHIRTIVMSAPLLIALGFSLSYYNANLFLLVLASILVGSGLACSNAPSTQLVLRFSPKGLSAFSTSLDITFARLGGIVTVAMLAEAEFAFAAPAICLSCLIAGLCVLATFKQLSDGY